MLAKDIKDILDAFEQAKKDYLYSYEQAGLKDKETQDILHALELDPITKKRTEQARHTPTTSAEGAQAVQGLRRGELPDLRVHDKRQGQEHGQSAQRGAGQDPQG